MQENINNNIYIQKSYENLKDGYIFFMHKYICILVYQETILCTNMNTHTHIFTNQHIQIHRNIYNEKELN